MKLRVLTYNIHKCIGGVDRRYDMARIAETIAHYQPDVLLLQEVDDQARRSNHDRQVEKLGELLDMHHRSWYANVRVRGGGEYGNAVISKYPVVSSTNVDLSVPYKKKRSVLHAEIRVRHHEVDRTLHVYNMHLGLAQYERKIQLRTFLACQPFAGLHHDTPIVVGGDFNDVWGSLGKLLTPSGFRGPTQSPRTFPAWAPMRALDSIYVRGRCELVEIARGETQLARRASDHRPLFADVVIEAFPASEHSHAAAEAKPERKRGETKPGHAQATVAAAATVAWVPARDAAKSGPEAERRDRRWRRRRRCGSITRMRTLLSLASVMILATALAACGDDTGGGPPEPGADGAVPDAQGSVDAAPAPDAGADAGPDDWTPAAAVLGNSGAGFRSDDVVLGGGGTLRTIVPITARGDAGPLAIVGDAVAVRGAGTDLFVKVRNTGDAMRCFVELADVAATDAAGAPVGDGSGTFAFIAGSIRETTSDVTTDSCLAPGESSWAVYATGLTVGETQAIARATVVLRSQAGGFVTPSAELVPGRQQLRAAGLAVELVNRGRSAAIFGGARWIGFDPAGLPVGWTWLMIESFEPEAPIAPGARVIATPYPRPIDGDLASPVRGVVASSIVRVDYKSE